MPSFLDGQQNLAGLSVPAVYADIILPQPFLLGTPTNIMGLVGVGSWGPLNSLIAVTNQLDCALKIGTPQVRNYDIATHVAAATQVGGNIGFQCVRVSDGTDTAASGVIASGGTTGVTLTAKYTGTLGNSIQASIQNGALPNSYIAVVSFPGLTPQQFMNIPSGAVSATGSIVFTANPLANATVTLNGSAVTFVASGATGNQVNIGATLAATLQSLSLFLNASSDTQISKCNYSTTVATTTLGVSFKTAGTTGNSFTLATNVSGATVSAGTLSGGVNLSNTFWVNLTNAINNGNAYSAPSNTVVATVGSATGAPVLSSPVTLSGGTDGASSVTDATLMGQDITPRKGVYVFRSSNVDSFTPIDLSTISYWAALVSLALSETMLAVVFAAHRVRDMRRLYRIGRMPELIPNGSGVLSGDWPYFFDSFNGLNRHVNPTAFALGVLGNLSPQQSPLNKPLQGIDQTDTSVLGETYGFTDLSLINLGGIDTILPANQSPGGFYFSFATGRNASSNTAANGIEYTRLTNFLIRAAQSQAAGSFIGQLQSIQPDDQTRNNAAALFNGLSAQLASPEVGLGINGQGIIDFPWIVQCDLANNPPFLQALGYLFLYWTVRYLNVIRYFVVKFQGGGNVTVNVQTEPPTPAQFANAINT